MVEADAAAAQVPAQRQAAGLFLRQRVQRDRRNLEWLPVNRLAHEGVIEGPRASG